MPHTVELPSENIAEETFACSVGLIGWGQLWIRGQVPGVNIGCQQQVFVFILNILDNIRPQRIQILDRPDKVVALGVLL